MPASRRINSPEILTTNGSRVQVHERNTRARHTSAKRKSLAMLCRRLYLLIAFAFSAFTLSKSTASISIKLTERSGMKSSTEMLYTEYFKRKVSRHWRVTKSRASIRNCWLFGRRLSWNSEKETERKWREKNEKYRKKIWREIEREEKSTVRTPKAFFRFLCAKNKK